MFFDDKAEKSVRCWDAASSNPNVTLMQGLKVGRDYRFQGRLTWTNKANEQQERGVDSGNLKRLQILRSRQPCKNKSA